MATPAHEQSTVELIECGICSDAVYRPVTLPCCGATFCQHCAQAHLRKHFVLSGICLCPGGCGTRLPVRLPAVSKMLQLAAEAVLPAEELARRKEEAEEAEQEQELPSEGGFRPWQEVCAAHDLLVGEKLVVVDGTPGVVVAAAESDANRIDVKFDERLDGHSFCMSVLPKELVPQLPASCGVLIGQRVFAAADLFAHQTLMIRGGTRGTPLAAAPGGRIKVAFDERVDGGARLNGGRTLNVLPNEIQLLRKLAGCFEVGETVRAKMDLKAGDTLLVRAGTRGKVVNEYSPGRVNIRFEEKEAACSDLVNVTPPEVERVTPAAPPSQRGSQAR